MPEAVLQAVRDASIEYKGEGMSVLEMSHRSRPIVELFDSATSRVRELLDVPSNYHVLWLQGGASLQFSMIPLNLLSEKGCADYLDTGAWSSKAIIECNRIGIANVIGSSKDSNYTYIPNVYKQNINSKYLHITSNNTIYGTQYNVLPEELQGHGPLIADMSSDILSRPIDISKFGLIYAGAQKNMGPAGTTLVIIKEEILNKISNTVPSMLSYKIQAEKDSMFNTPPVFAVYTSMLNMRWVNSKGGIEKLGEQNMQKAKLLYGEIDRNSKFVGFAAKEDRSDMNATFNLVDQNDSESFDGLCNAAGISGLKGHRSVGGYRASMYNALPIESIDVLVECMQSLEKNK